MEVNVKDRPDRTSDYKFNGTFYAYENKLLPVVGGQASRVNLTPENRPKLLVNEYMLKRSSLKGAWFVEDALNAAALYIDVATSDEGTSHFIWHIAASSEAYATFVVGLAKGTNFMEKPGDRLIKMATAAESVSDAPEEEDLGEDEGDEEDEEDEEDEDREEFVEGEIVYLHSDVFAKIIDVLSGDKFIGINENGDRIDFTYDDISESADLDSAYDALVGAFDLDSYHLDGDYNIVRWKGQLTKIESVSAQEWEMEVDGEWVAIGPGDGQIKVSDVSFDDTYQIDQDVYIRVQDSDGDTEAQVKAQVKGLNTDERRYIVEPYEEQLEISEGFLEEA